MKVSRIVIVGGLGVALLGVCAATLAVFYFTAMRLSAAGVRTNFFSVNQTQAESEEEQRFAVETAAVLDVQNDFGDISVVGGEGREIVVKAHKTAWGSNPANAEAAVAAIKIIVTQTGNKVTVRVERPIEIEVMRIGPNEGTVNFTIEVPASTEVIAHTNFGAVQASGTRGSAELLSGSGEVRAADLQGGSLILKSSFGSVTLDDSMAAEVEAQSDSGSVTLTHVEVEGRVNLTSQFGALKFEQGRAGALTTETTNGEVRLISLAITETITAHSDFGAVTLKDVRAASYDLTSNNGDVDVTGAGGPVTAHTQFGSITVTGAEAATLDLRSNNGAVSFSGTLGDGPHTVKSDFGSLRLALPATAALDFDLKTDMGSIRSDLPITISGVLDEKHWQGTVNGGGASLTAQTNNGDITLEILR